MQQTYILKCDGNRLSRAPGIRIGLVNVMTCGLI